MKINDIFFGPLRQILDHAEKQPWMKANITKPDPSPNSGTQPRKNEYDGEYAEDDPRDYPEPTYPEEPDDEPDDDKVNGETRLHFPKKPANYCDYE